MGYAREDWLFLWNAMDPASAPAGATGVFARPFATFLWRSVTTLFGDDPFAMHAFMLLGALLLLMGVVRLFGVLLPRSPLAVAAGVAVVGTHAALLELRVWASASNGLWAGALGVWALVLFLKGGRSQKLAIALFVLAIMARADAVALALLAWSLTDGRRVNRRSVATGLVAVVLGLVALAVMQSGGGEWGWRAEHGGRLMRRLWLPWGSPLPSDLARGVGMIVPPLLLWIAVGRTGHEREDGAVRGAWLLVAIPVMAGCLVPWAPAGRYLLVPVLGLGMLVAFAVARGPGKLAVLVATLAFAFSAAGAGSHWMGTTAADLQARSAAETALYRVIRPHSSAPIVGVGLVNSPPMGWESSAADAENVVSCALRRETPVQWGHSAAAGWLTVEHTASGWILQQP